MPHHPHDAASGNEPSLHSDRELAKRNAQFVKWSFTVIFAVTVATLGEVISQGKILAGIQAREDGLDYRVTMLEDGGVRHNSKQRPHTLDDKSPDLIP